MALTREVYAEGRASIHESIVPYVVQRYRSERTTTVSEPRRFLALSVGVLACICASTSYVYNLFSGRLQEKYNFTQKQMATITTLASIFGMVALPLGGVYDYYGPRPLFFISMLTFPLGALLFGLAFADAFDGSVVRFTICNTLLGIGTNMFDVGALMTVLSIFPSSRGAVIAVMKTFIGLGSAIFGAIQLGFFEDDISLFFFFLALFVAVVGFLSFFLIRLPPYQLTGYDEKYLSESAKQRRLATKRAYFEQVPPARRFIVGFVIVAALILFLPVQSALVAFKDLSHTYKLVFAIVTIALVAVFPIVALPIRWLSGGSAAIEERLRNATDEEDDHVAPVLTPSALQRMSARMSQRLASTRGSIVEEAVFHMPIVDESEHIAPQYQTAFVESVCTPQLWALAYSLFGIFGAQMVIIVNARFIYAAVAESSISEELATLLTVFNGVGSALGRILMSIFEVWTQKRPAEERIPLTVALFIPSTAVLLSSLLLLFAPKELLVVPFVLTALANGFSAATVVLVMRTLYAKDIANHYNFMSLASVAASILLNKLLYGEWYTREATQRGGTLCFGRSCIFVPFAVMSVIVFTTLFTDYYVHRCYGAYCRTVLDEHAQLLRENAAETAGRRQSPAPRGNSTTPAVPPRADLEEQQPLLNQ